MNLLESDKFIIIASDGVWEFISNDEAVNFLTQNTYDLILVDIHMNGLSFRSFLSYLKDPLHSFSDIPVIAVTGIPQDIHLEDKPMLYDVLEKPFTPDIMLTSVKNALR